MPQVSGSSSYDYDSYSGSDGGEGAGGNDGAGGASGSSSDYPTHPAEVSQDCGDAVINGSLAAIGCAGAIVGGSVGILVSGPAAPATAFGVGLGVSAACGAAALVITRGKETCDGVDWPIFPNPEPKPEPEDDTYRDGYC
jgi:hypothetical protein